MVPKDVPNTRRDSSTTGVPCSPQLTPIMSQALWTAGATRDAGATHEHVVEVGALASELTRELLIFSDIGP